MDDPLSLRNIKKISSNSISGIDWLTKYHRCTTRFRQGNESHPLRVAEQAEARTIIKSSAPAEDAPINTKPYPKKRVKREAPKMDSDGKYRL